MSRSRPATSRLVSSIALCVVAGCHDSVSPDSWVAHIEKVSGDAETFEFHSPRLITPVVRVTDADGNPVQGATVTFHGNLATSTPWLPEAVKSDADGLVVGPDWAPLWVGSNSMIARIGADSVIFEAIGVCRVTETLVMGDRRTRSLTPSSCRYEPPACGFGCFASHHERFAFVATSRMVVGVGPAAPGTWLPTMTLFDSERRPVAIGEALRAIIPAGQYEIEVLSPFGPTSYTIAIDAVDEDIGGEPAFLTRGIITQQRLGQPADLRDGFDRFIDRFVVMLRRGEGVTVQLSSTQFAPRLEILTIVQQTEIRDTAEGDGVTARVTKSCPEDECYLRITVTSRDLLSTGAYTLAIE